MGWGLALGQAAGEALGAGYNAWQQQEALKREEEKRLAELEFRKLQEDVKLMLEEYRQKGAAARNTETVTGRQKVAETTAASREKVSGNQITSREGVSYLDREARGREGAAGRTNAWKIAGLQSGTSRANAATAADASRFNAFMSSSTARRGQNITRENNLMDLYSNLFRPPDVPIPGIQAPEQPAFNAWSQQFPEPKTPLMTAPVVKTPTAAANPEQEAARLLGELEQAKQAADYRKAQQIQIQLAQLLSTIRR